jgi:hypothetical protein
MGDGVRDRWHTRRKDRRREPSQLAKLTVDIATGDNDEPAELEGLPESRHGRLGGLAGAEARAPALSPEQRSQIASAAARARWSKRAQES